MSSWTAELSALFGARAGATCTVGEHEVPLLAPAGDEEWSQAMRFAGERNLSVLPVGLGSKLPSLPLAARPDLVLSTRHDRGIVASEPGDGTLTARAGTTVAELRAAALEHGYALTPDVARAEQKTLGGVIGAGESGFDRLRRGPVRHHVLGTRLLRADGCIAKSGGALVKNVTGYDLHRLYTGSRGSLGVVLEASLRLSPAPETRARLEAMFADRGAALAFARQVLTLDLSLDALTVRRIDRGFATELFLGGRQVVISAELARLERAASAHDAATAEGSAAESLYAAAREREPSSAHLFLSATRTAFAPSLDALDQLFAKHGVTGTELLHPGIASAQIEVAAPDELPTLEAIRAALPANARIQWRGLLPPAVRNQLAQLPPVGSAPASRVAVQLRRALDPEGRFAAVATP